MRRIGALLVALVVVGCGQVDGGADGSTTSSAAAPTTPEPNSTTTVDAPVTTGSSSSAQSTAVQNATAELSSRAGVPVSEIRVVEAKAVSWPDGSLGCPREGEMYTQAIVDGHQIFLSAGDRIFDYRSDAEGNVVLCPSDERDGGYEFIPPPREG